MGLLLTISTIRGGMTLGWMSWICKTCLLYSSVIVLISVRQASTLGYNMLEKHDGRSITVLSEKLHIWINRANRIVHSLFFWSCSLRVDPGF